MKVYRFKKIANTKYNGIKEENGYIKDLICLSEGDAYDFDYSDKTAIPGFCDCHIHGALGYDVSTCTADDLIKVAKGLYKHGTFAFMPTIPASHPELNLKALKTINEAMIKSEKETDCALILGCHMEGPFLCEKYKGSLDETSFCDATKENWKKLTGEYENIVKRITVDPLRKGVIDMIPYFTDRGIQVTVGHTDSKTADVKAAFSAGATSVTHLYNAMSGLHHREPGTVGTALSSDDTYAEIICDFLHVAPDAVKLAIKAKTPDRISVITDSCQAAGMPDGEYELAGRRILVVKGEARMPEGQLASSTVFQDKELKNLMSLGFNIDDCSKMLTSNPMKLCKKEGLLEIKIGNKFNFLAVSDSGEVSII